jgi:hydroxymethylpyrimidine/phosphomethylpyrimidine kinase
MSGEECPRGGVVKLTTIITPNSFDDVAKLCEDKGQFFDKMENASDLIHEGKMHTKWERSSIMSR